jgi:hypothetical protein
MTQQASALDAIVHTVSKVFDRFCDEHHLTVLASAIDRHGSIEWSAIKSVGALNRYLGFAITVDGSAPTKRRLLLDWWIGADDGARFTRRTENSAEVNAADALKIQGLLQELPGDLLKAWSDARSLTPLDLTETYLIPHSSAAE